MMSANDMSVLMVALIVMIALIALAVVMLWTRVGRLEDLTGVIRKEVQEQTRELTISADRRSSILHNRINPLIETMSGLKGSQEAFVQSFDNFTAVMKGLKDKG